MGKDYEYEVLAREEHEKKLKWLRFEHELERKFRRLGKRNALLAVVAIFTFLIVLFHFLNVGGRTLMLVLLSLMGAVIGFPFMVTLYVLFLIYVFKRDAGHSW